MSIEFKEYIQAPTETIEITPQQTSQTLDVKDYATAQVGAAPVISVNTRTGAVTGLAEQSTLDAVAEPLINQWDEEWELGSLTSQGVEIDSSTSIRSVKHNAVKPSTTYYFHIGVSGSSIVAVCYYNSSKAFISRDILNGSGSITTPSGTNYIRFNLNASYGTTYNHDISINYPSTYTAYYPSRIAKDEAHIKGLGNAIGMRGWNQLVKMSGWATDGVISYSGDVINFYTSSSIGRLWYPQQTIQNHKYYVSAYITSSKAGTIRLEFSRGWINEGFNISQNTKTKFEWITTLTNDYDEYQRSPAIYLIDSDYTLNVENVMLIDLTALFGSGNEPSTVADFRAMFPKEYYGYHNNVNSLADLNYTIVSTWT